MHRIMTKKSLRRRGEFCHPLISLSHKRSICGSILNRKAVSDIYHSTMKTISIIPALAALAAATVAAADTAAPAPAPAPAAPAGNCDLLAANTVRAALRDVREITTQSPEQDQPVTARVAVFEVIENLAYKKYVRYGDGRLEPGTRFTVELRKDIPGQPAAVADEIQQMKIGEEAVLKMDHLFMIGSAGNDPVRACSRIARSGAEAPAVPAQPAEQPQQAPEQPAAPQAQADSSVPTTAAPLGSGGNRAPRVPQMDDEDDFMGMGGAVGALLQGGMPTGGSGSSFQISFGGGNGANVQSTQVMQTYDSRTGKMVKRMFINGEEVDPETRQPLKKAEDAPKDQPSQTAPDSDTILETPKPDTAPDNSKPAISAEDSF